MCTSTRNSIYITRAEQVKSLARPPPLHRVPPPPRNQTKTFFSVSLQNNSNIFFHPSNQRHQPGRVFLNPPLLPPSPLLLSRPLPPPLPPPSPSSSLVLPFSFQMDDEDVVFHAPNDHQSYKLPRGMRDEDIIAYSSAGESFESRSGAVRVFFSAGFFFVFFCFAVFALLSCFDRTNQRGRTSSMVELATKAAPSRPRNGATSVARLQYRRRRRRENRGQGASSSETPTSLHTRGKGFNGVPAVKLSLCLLLVLYGCALSSSLPLFSVQTKSFLFFLPSLTSLSFSLSVRPPLSLSLLLSPGPQNKSDRLQGLRSVL